MSEMSEETFISELKKYNPFIQAQHIIPHLDKYMGLLANGKI